MRLRHCAWTGIAAGILLVISTAQAEEERRELGAHAHGHGTLAIAIATSSIQMELSVPGMDIVGFEHEPETARQKRAVEAALADLKQPLNLFGLPGYAECAVTSAEVGIVVEKHKDDDAPTEAQKAAMTEEDDGHHTEFRASYAFNCADAAQVRSIDFRFFDRFRDSGQLYVTFTDADGTTGYAVSREARNMER